MTNIIDSVSQKLRPWIPCTELNQVWHKIDKKSKTILDVGCGRGIPLMFINRRKAFYVIGIDTYKPYIEWCSRLPVYDSVVLSNALTLPFRQKSFDTVLCMEVLEHLDQKDGQILLQAIESIARRQVIITTPVAKYRQRAYDGNPFQEHRYIWNQSVLQQMGYKVTRIGLRGLNGDEDSFISHLPKMLKPLIYMIWVIAAPFVYFFPSFAGSVVATKTMDTQ